MLRRTRQRAIDFVAKEKGRRVKTYAYAKSGPRYRGNGVAKDRAFSKPTGDMSVIPPGPLGNYARADAIPPCLSARYRQTDTEPGRSVSK